MRGLITDVESISNGASREKPVAGMGQAGSQAGNQRRLYLENML